MEKELRGKIEIEISPSVRVKMYQLEKCAMISTLTLTKIKIRKKIPSNLVQGVQVHPTDPYRRKLWVWRENSRISLLTLPISAKLNWVDLNWQTKLLNRT